MKLKQTHAAKMARRRTITCSIALLLIISMIVGISSCVSHKKEAKAEAVEKAKQEAILKEQNKDELDKFIEEMSLEEKICQMLVVTPETLTGSSVVTAAGQKTEEAIKKYPVGGLVYRAVNMTSESQVKEMLSHSQDYAKAATGIPMFSAITEEGGDNSPVASALSHTRFNAPYTYAERSNGVSMLTNNMRDLGLQLAGLGFNLNVAPYADCLAISASEGSRSFGADATKTSELVDAAVKGLHSGGVGSVLKYFPTAGEYDSSGNIVAKESLSTLEGKDFLPFKSGIAAGADVVMVGHVQLETVDKGVPSDLSEKVVTDMLRTGLGYKGLVMTSSLSETTVTSLYKGGEIAVKAVLAGCDMLYNPASISSVVDALTAAVKDGTIKEDKINASVKRILQTKITLGIMVTPSQMNAQQAEGAEAAGNTQESSTASADTAGVVGPAAISGTESSTVFSTSAAQTQDYVQVA